MNAAEDAEVDPLGPNVPELGIFEGKLAECTCTHGYDAKKIRQLKAVSKKRNNAFYDAPGSVTTQDLQLTLKLAKKLRDDLKAWLKTDHPELL